MGKHKFEVQINDQYLETGIECIQMLKEDFLDGYGYSDSELKYADRIVTDMDKEFDKRIRRKISEEYPEHDILSEESSEKKDMYDLKDGFQWIIDPIDGSRNYAVGELPSSVSIGLEKDGELYLGVIGNPLRNSINYAVQNQGAYCNGEKIQVSDEQNLNYYQVGVELRNIVLTNESYYNFIRKISKEIGRVKCINSGVFELLSVAKGNSQAFANKYTNPWDVAAGAILVQESGGQVTTLEGVNSWKQIKQGNILATNGLYHDSFVNMFTE